MARTQTMSRADLMLLGLLVRQPMHGYELSERLSQPGMDAWVQLGKTSVYYALGRLERMGHVTKHVERVGGKPERTVYSITEEGRRQFLDGLEDSLRDPEESMDSFEIALYYLNHLDPDRVVHSIDERLDTLQADASRVGSIINDAHAHDDPQLVLVLEHRLAVLAADLDYLTSLVRLIRGGASGTMSGSLGETPVHEVLKGLESASRTGVLDVTSGACSVRFCFDRGRLYGVNWAGAHNLDSALACAMQSSTGTYEFVASDVMEAETESVSGVTDVIMRGARGTTSDALLSQMLPDPLVILDRVPDHALAMVGHDITSQERETFAAVDGLRTVGEIARAFGVSTQTALTTLYPMWAAGWIVRSSGEKRSLVMAMIEYVTGWREALSSMVGDSAAQAIIDDVRRAAADGGILDFAHPGGLGELGLFRDAVMLSDDARRFAELLRRAISARLGATFVSEVGGAMQDSMRNDYFEQLVDHGVMTGTPARTGG